MRSVFPPCAVFQSATPADCTSRRSSSVVRARVCERARGVRACVRAGGRTCVRAFFASLERTSAPLEWGANIQVAPEGADRASGAVWGDAEEGEATQVGSWQQRGGLSCSTPDDPLAIKSTAPCAQLPPTE